MYYMQKAARGCAWLRGTSTNDKIFLKRFRVIAVLYMDRRWGNGVRL